MTSEAVHLFQPSWTVEKGNEVAVISQSQMESTLKVTKCFTAEVQGEGVGFKVEGVTVDIGDVVVEEVKSTTVRHSGVSG